MAALPNDLSPMQAAAVLVKLMTAHDPRGPLVVHQLAGKVALGDKTATAVMTAIMQQMHAINCGILSKTLPSVAPEALLMPKASMKGDVSYCGFDMPSFIPANVASMVTGAAPTVLSAASSLGLPPSMAKAAQDQIASQTTPQGKGALKAGEIALSAPAAQAAQPGTFTQDNAAALAKGIQNRDVGALAQAVPDLGKNLSNSLDVVQQQVNDGDYAAAGGTAVNAVLATVTGLGFPLPREVAEVAQVGIDVGQLATGIQSGDPKAIIKGAIGLLKDVGPLIADSYHDISKLLTKAPPYKEQADSFADRLTRDPMAPILGEVLGLAGKIKSDTNDTREDKLTAVCNVLVAIKQAAQDLKPPPMLLEQIQSLFDQGIEAARLGWVGQQGTPAAQQSQTIGYEKAQPYADKIALAIVQLSQASAAAGNQQADLLKGLPEVVLHFVLPAFMVLSQPQAQAVAQVLRSCPAEKLVIFARTLGGLAPLKMFQLASALVALTSDQLTRFAALPAGTVSGMTPADVAAWARGGQAAASGPSAQQQVASQQELWNIEQQAYAQQMAKQAPVYQQQPRQVRQQQIAQQEYHVQTQQEASRAFDMLNTEAAEAGAPEGGPAPILVVSHEEPEEPQSYQDEIDDVAMEGLSLDELEVMADIDAATMGNAWPWLAEFAVTLPAIVASAAAGNAVSTWVRGRMARQAEERRAGK